jgi:glycosyltransferase involved in cell wall biosynthesis
MKIFVVIPQKFAGCGFYRQYQPHDHLMRNYDADVLLGAGLYNADDTFGVDADIVHIHKGYIPGREEIQEAQSRGIVVVGDFDDWWQVDTEHIFYKQYLEQGTTKILVDFLKSVDYVTCSTELLADEARKYNPNVVVLPNAMNMAYPGCKIDRKTGAELVFGYLGGTCHGKDVELLRGLNNRLSGEYRFRLFGYDRSEVYNKYADVLSDSGRKMSHFDMVEKANIWDYPQFYNYLDVSLVPLVSNRFNSLKSELKLIEAGFFRKGVIVSNVEPYSRLLKHKVNCFVVNKPRDWEKGCRWYLEDPRRVIETGNALYETVQPYHIDRVNEKRYKFYKDVLEKRNTNRGD